MPASPDGLRFAVYLCPPADDPFYRLGSDLLGHDVRAERESHPPAFVRPEWQSEASPYGFHLTLVEGFYTASGHWPELEAELLACCACLSPQADLRLSNGRLERWRGEVFVWRMDATPHLQLFQTLLAARLARYVTGSPFDAEAREHPERYAEPYQQARLRLLRTPRGLDTWQPHYTLVQPFQGSEAQAAQLGHNLEERLAPYREQPVSSVALFRKDEGERCWRVVRDLPVGQPQPVPGS